MDNTCWRMSGVWFLCAGWLSALRGERQARLPLQSRPMFSFGKHPFGSCVAYLSRRYRFCPSLLLPLARSWVSRDGTRQGSRVPIVWWYLLSRSHGARDLFVLLDADDAIGSSEYFPIPRKTIFQNRLLSSPSCCTVKSRRRSGPEDGVIEECYLVDPASSHMLVSKIKPCMCKYELIQTVKLRMAH